MAAERWNRLRAWTVGAGKSRRMASRFTSFQRRATEGVSPRSAVHDPSSDEQPASEAATNAVTVRALVAKRRDLDIGLSLAPGPLGATAPVDPRRAASDAREIVSSFEVVEFEEGALIRIRSTSGMPLDITRRVDRAGQGGSLVSAIVRGDSSGLFRVADPVMRAVVGRSVSKDYERLRARLED